MFDFINMTPVQITGQIFGFVAMALALFSFQVRRSKYILLFQAFAAVFWVAHFFMLGAISAAALSAITVVRNLMYMLRDKMSARTFSKLPIIAIGAFVFITFFTYEGPLTLLPLFGSIAATFAFYVKNENLIRLLSISVSIAWIIYNAINGSIAGVMNEALSMVSITVSLIRYRKLGFNKNSK